MQTVQQKNAATTTCVQTALFDVRTKIAKESTAKNARDSQTNAADATAQRTATVSFYAKTVRSAS